MTVSRGICTTLSFCAVDQLNMSIFNDLIPNIKVGMDLEMGWARCAGHLFQRETGLRLRARSADRYRTGVHSDFEIIHCSRDRIRL